jgi:hypothetical protein
MWITLVVSVLLNVATISAYVWQSIEIEFSREQIETFITVSSGREPTHALHYIKSYYLPGTKLRADGTLSQIVEMVRTYILDIVEKRSLGDAPL